MNELTILNIRGTNVIDSREVDTKSQYLIKSHYKKLRRELSARWTI